MNKEVKLLVDIYSNILNKKCNKDDWDILDDCIRSAYNHLIFEFNDEVLRDQINRAFSHFCDEYKFYIQCNSLNNPPIIIDRNELVIEFFKGGKRRIYTIGKDIIYKDLYYNE